jgi:hypothetical protein
MPPGLAEAANDVNVVVSGETPRIGAPAKST